MAERLEKVVKKKVTPVVEKSLHKILGVTIDELNEDISEKIEKNPLLDFNVNTNMKFKDAKNYSRKITLKNY